MKKTIDVIVPVYRPGQKIRTAFIPLIQAEFGDSQHYSDAYTGWLWSGVGYGKISQHHCKRYFAGRFRFMEEREMRESGCRMQMLLCV